MHLGDCTAKYAEPDVTDHDRSNGPVEFDNRHQTVSVDVVDVVEFVREDVVEESGEGFAER